MCWSKNLKAVISFDQFLNILSQLALGSNMLLEFFHAVNSQHKPQLQRPESATQWNLPILKDKPN